MSDEARDIANEYEWPHLSALDIFARTGIMDHGRMREEIAQHREDLCNGTGEWRDFLGDIHALHDLEWYVKDRTP